MIETTPEWFESAACRGANAKVFQQAYRSIRGDHTNYRMRHRARPGPVEDAKAICDTCMVKLQCRRYSLEQNEKDGVWGGWDAFDRIEYWRRSRNLRVIA